MKLCKCGTVLETKTVRVRLIDPVMNNPCPDGNRARHVRYCPACDEEPYDGMTLVDLP